ncbi:lipoprotein [Listeria grandensis FSL F6-0971]|uniref:Lipoprotein n=2 Tax=Listeria grandensis TaxID=1494963 RepID=W7AX48_9LIST|nr:lipoprotein [Listeria grandensis FSL F6-0971]
MKMKKKWLVVAMATVMTVGQLLPTFVEAAKAPLEANENVVETTKQEAKTTAIPEFPQKATTFDELARESRTSYTIQSIDNAAVAYNSANKKFEHKLSGRVSNAGFFNLQPRTSTYSFNATYYFSNGAAPITVSLNKGALHAPEEVIVTGTEIFLAMTYFDNPASYAVATLDINGKRVSEKTAVFNTPTNVTPTITSDNQTVTVGDTFDPMKNVSATDFDGKPLTVRVKSSNVNTSQVGTYSVVYETTGKIQTVTKTITVTVVAPENRIIALDTFMLNESTAITGTYAGNISQVSLSVNGVEGFKQSVSNGNIQLTAVNTIKSKDDTVVVNAYDILGNLVDSKPLTVNEREQTGAITQLDNYMVKQDRYVTGRYSGDVALISLTINGVEQTRVSVTNGTINYYVWGLISNVSDTVVVNAYDKNGQILDRKSPVLTTYESVGSITKLDNFSVGADRYVTGNYAGDVARIGLEVNGTELGRIGVTGGAFQYYTPTAISSLGDTVWVNAYDSNNKLLDRKQVTLVDSARITKIDNYVVGADSRVNGTYTGDITHVRLEVNGILQARIPVVDGAFSYWARELITAPTDKVNVIAYDKTGVTVDTKPVTIAASTGSLTSNVFTLGDSRVTGTYTGSISRINIEVNGLTGGSIPVDGSGNFSYWIGNLGVASTSDVIYVIGTDIFGKEVLRQKVTINQGEAGTVSVNNFVLGSASVVSGTYSGDVTHIRLEVNGELQGRIPVSGGIISYWARDLITATTDNVRIIAYNGAGGIVAEETVTVVPR